jgi:CRISPR-associated protein Cmr2
VELRKDIYEAHRAPNPPYYALLIADGDRMGAAIEAISERKLHQQFSQRLSQFAGEAARLIEGEPYHGCPVYVGGDDVMALLPLHMALECVCELRKLFLDKMRGPWPKQPTFSAGLAVVHALEPLTEAREIAMRAERAAKDPRKGDRDALAVIHAPRSGPEMLAYGKFPEFPERLLKIAELYRDKALSLGFAHELRDLLSRTPSELDDVLGKMAKAIGKKKEAKEEALRLLEACSNRDQLDNLYRALLVARPFYRAKNEAGL